MEFATSEPSMIEAMQGPCNYICYVGDVLSPQQGYIASLLPLCYIIGSSSTTIIQPESYVLLWLGQSGHECVN